MKSFKVTFAFSLLVTVVLGYSLYELKEHRDEGEQSGDLHLEKVFPGLQKKKLIRLKINRSIKPFELSYEKKQWRVLKPVNDAVDMAQWSQFLAKVKKQEGQRLQEGEKVDWAQYGLAQPVATLVLDYEGGSSESVNVSLRKSYDKKSYVRRKDQLLLTEENWDDLIYKPLKDFRSKEIAKFSKDIVKIEDKLQGRKVVLLQNKGQWEFQRSSKVKVNSDQVESWLNKIKAWRASDFASNEKNEKTLKAYGLSQPERKIKLYNSQGKVQEFYLSQPKNKKVTVMATDQPFLYSLSEGTAQSLPFGVGFFRDRKYPFVFSTNEAREFIYKHKDLKVHAVREGDRWVPHKSMKKGLDLNQVSRVLDEVRKLQVKEFLKFKVKKKTSLSSMVVKGKNKKLLFELVWDPSFDRKGNMWVLRSSLSSETLGVSELSFKPLTEVPWFKVSTEKPSKINPDTDER